MSGKARRETDEQTKPAESFAEKQSREASQKILEEVSPPMPTQRRQTSDAITTDSGKTATDAPANPSSKGIDTTSTSDAKADAREAVGASGGELDKDGSRKVGSDSANGSNDQGPDRVTGQLGKNDEQGKVRDSSPGDLGRKGGDEAQANGKLEPADSKGWDLDKKEQGAVEHLGGKDRDLSKYGIEENPGGSSGQERSKPQPEGRIEDNPGEPKNRGVPDGQPGSKPPLPPETGAGESTVKSAPSRAELPNAENGGGGQAGPRGGPPGAGQSRDMPTRADGGNDSPSALPQRGNASSGGDVGLPRVDPGQSSRRGEQTDSTNQVGYGRSTGDAPPRDSGARGESKMPEQSRDGVRANRDNGVGNEQTSAMHKDLARQESPSVRQREQSEVENQRRAGTNQSEIDRQRQTAERGEGAAHQRAIQQGNLEHRETSNHPINKVGEENSLRRNVGPGVESKEARAEDVRHIVPPVAKGGLEKVASDKEAPVMSMQSFAHGIKSGDKAQESHTAALDKANFKAMLPGELNPHKGLSGDLQKGALRLEGQISHVSITADTAGGKSIGPIGKIDPSRANVEQAGTVKAIAAGHSAEAAQAAGKGAEAVRAGKDIVSAGPIKPNAEGQASHVKQPHAGVESQTAGSKPTKSSTEVTGSQGQSTRQVSDPLAQGQRSVRTASDTTGKSNPVDKVTLPGEKGSLTDAANSGHHAGKREFTGAEIALAALIAAAGTARVRADQVDDLRIKRGQIDGNATTKDQPIIKGQAQDMSVGRADTAKENVGQADSSSKDPLSKGDSGKELITKQEGQKGQSDRQDGQKGHDSQSRVAQDRADKGGDKEQVPENVQFIESAKVDTTDDEQSAIMPGLLEQLHIPGQAIGLEKKATEGEEAEEEVLEGAESDDTNSKAASQTVMLRPTCLISQQDTLVSLAEELFHDANLGWLIADLNRGQLKDSFEEGRRIVEVRNRQELVLPVWQDIVEFYENRPAGSSPENLITIVVETQLDRELLDSALGVVMGGTTSGERTINMPSNKDKSPIVKPVLLKAAKLFGYALPDLGFGLGIGDDEKKPRKKSPSPKSAPPLSP